MKTMCPPGYHDYGFVATNVSSFFKIMKNTFIFCCANISQPFQYLLLFK